MSIQIPSLHVSNHSQAKGKAEVFITSRKDAAHAGTFDVELNLHFDAALDVYPAGSLALTISLSDSLKCQVKATTIEQVNTYGKHNPTLYATGRCDLTPQEDGPKAVGCRYWLMVADNSLKESPEATPDVIGFLIYDRNGVRMAYGTGPVKSGNIVVTATGE
jgi:hypothetical protein